MRVVNCWLVRYRMDSQSENGYRGDTEHWDSKKKLWDENCFKAKRNRSVS